MALQGPADEAAFPFSYYRVRLLLSAAALAAAGLFWIAGDLVGIPSVRGFDASLLFHPAPAVALLTTLVIFLAATFVGTLIAGRVRLDAGLFAAAIGLSVFSLRGGPSRYVVGLFDSPNGFITLAVETVILFLFVGVAWYGLRIAHVRGQILGDVSRDGIVDKRIAFRDILLAAILHALVMGAIVALLAQADAKKQVVGALIIASCVASVATYSLVPVQRSIAYWLGPLIVAVVGYLAASTTSADTAWWLSPRGLLAGLARPLPLDYASIGVAGSLLGYWMGRRGQVVQAPAAGEKDSAVSI